MAYVSLNNSSLKMRESGISKRIREDKLAQNERFELRKSIYGNVYLIIDHERKVFYRQDKPIFEQLDLLDDNLPRYCDYCKSYCDEIDLIEYELVYEMIVRPMTNPTIKKEKRKVTYATCPDCMEKSKKFIPQELLKGYLYEVYRNGELAWKRHYLHYNGKLTMPWTAI